MKSESVRGVCASPCPGMSQRDAFCGSEVTRAGSTLGVLPLTHLFQAPGGISSRFGLAALTEGTAQQDLPSLWHVATWGTRNLEIPAGRLAPKGCLISIFQWNPHYFQDCWNIWSVMYQKKYFLYIYFRSQVIFSLPSSFDGIHRWYNKENEHFGIFLEVSLHSCFL